MMTLGGPRPPPLAGGGGGPALGRGMGDIAVCGAVFPRYTLPRVICFDVDFTLWPFWVDTHRDPPYKQQPCGRVVDAEGRCCALYPDVPRILRELRALPAAARPVLAFASRTSAPEWLEDLAKVTRLGDALTMWDAPDHREIYPGSKLRHFRKIAAATGVAPHEMLFFDDEVGSNRDVLQLGVKFVEVKNGMNVSLLHQGLRWYAERHGQTEGALLRG
eukprot:TRINITY_DN10852_c0_g1_i1.p1 TRINITY_DN10852_c0_g1~~TRINITY_DN10852_c0_g1_i1.p1  ORF type:complete len:218 (+),score=36.35 TRINITY_DN10852_c0_g1_i1:63-716(+)